MKTAERPILCKLISHQQLSQIISKNLRWQWSLQKVAGFLKRAYPDDEDYQVSHQTFYRTLYIEIRGALKKSYNNALEANVGCVDQSTQA
ncbi:MAG: IS30 family transposase [Urechidicola sp.]|jgi:IS30 family transposase